IEETARERSRFEFLEREALAAGDAAGQRECRAQVEQMTRQLARLKTLPPGKSYPLQITVAQLGDALWVLVPGGLYQTFQTTLRQRSPPQRVIVATPTNDWPPGYIPAASSCGYGIYQDVIAAVAPGSLETLVEFVSRFVRDLLLNAARALSGK